MSIWKANRLRVLRAERRISQRTLAQRIGVSQSTYSNWETAYFEPDADTKRKIARVLRVPVEALIPGDQAVTA
jgi:putative transcriptional regulator